MFRANSLSVPFLERLRRSSTRPVDLRDVHYGERFDDTTLVFDIARPYSDDRIVAIAPPLRNLATLLKRTRVGSVPLCSGKVIEQDRLSDIWLDGVDLDSNIESDWIESANINEENLNNIFTDRRVLHTLSLNNKPEWIVRWIEFNRSNHGADGVLIYDNGSVLYSAEWLEDFLRNTFPDLVIAVVAWPFKLGPQAWNGSAWDSDFCQHGAFHSARYRFLQAARSVLNSDIDELVVSKNGASVFEETERSASGYIHFAGRWVLPKDRNSDDHRDSIYLQAGVGACPYKWCVVPNRCDKSNQWCTHRIINMPSHNNENFEYRHFRLVSNNWKGSRGPGVGEIDTFPEEMLLSHLKKMKL